MDTNIREVYLSFTEYVSKHVKPEELKTMSYEIEDALNKSKRTSKQIMEVLKSSSAATAECGEVLQNHDDITQFLNSKCNLLLPDMVEVNDLNIKEAISEIKSNAENLKSSYCNKTTVSPDNFSGTENMSNLELEEYSQSLRILNQRLGKLDLCTVDAGACERNLELEKKLSKLMVDVAMLMKMVNTQTSIAESNEKWSNKQHTDHNIALNYSQIIEKILTKTNEVSYALSNRNKK